MGKRINTLNTASSPANDDYLPIDGATNGTRKISADFVNNLITDVEVDGTSVVTSGVAEIDLSGKQDTLTAGSNITIAQDGTISATDTTYTAGTNVDITGGVISATDTTYTAGTNVTIDANNVISASDTTYSAGTNVQINNGVISATDTTYSAFGGATAGTDGSSGLVPQPLIADKDKFLKGDGTWDTIQPGASALDDLTNVDITSPTNGQVLKYDSTNQEWVNANESGGGGGSTVTITPTLSTGTKIADYSIDGSTGALYAPNGGGGSTKHYLGQLIERVNAADSRITCSSENSSYPAWCAFNGISPSNLSNPNANTCWLSIIGTSDQTPWIKYHFDDVRYFTKLGLKCFSNFSDAWVGDIQVLGSNDDVTYTNILASGNTYELTAPLCVNTVISIDLDDTDTWQYIKILSNDPTSVGSAPSLFIDEIYVYGGELQAIPENLGDLQNVTITSPTDGQGLVYDATNQIWVNGDVGGGGGGATGDSFITYTKTVTTTNYGWWTVEDKDGNVLDPDEYIIVDISVTPYYYDVLWSIETDGGNHYYATLININDVYEIRSSTTYDWTITYAKKDFSGGGGAGAEEISLSEYNALTTAQKNDGTIRFIPENPYGIITDVDMSTITNLSENRITVTPSADEIEIDFDHNAGNSIGGTFYISAPVDVTNYDYLKYDLATGVCYNSLHSDTNPGRNLGIGLCRNAPSSWQICPNVSWEVSNIYDVNDVNLTFTDEIIDVSALTGQYYFVVAFVAWEATISNLKLATAGGYPSQIKYMSKTYADGTGGGGSDSGYTETVLNNGTHSGDVYTLSDSISNYDMLEIEWIYNSAYYGTSITSVESFKTNATGILVDNTDNILFVMQYTSETTMTRTQSYGLLEVRQIKGLKFGGGGGGIDYSAAEQDTGLKWIDGSAVYQKTINIVNSSSVAATRDIDLSSYVPSGARVIEFSGIYEYVYGNKNYGMAIGSNYVYGYMHDNAYKLKIDFGSGSFDSDEVNLTIKYTKASS